MEDKKMKLEKEIRRLAQFACQERDYDFARELYEKIKDYQGAIDVTHQELEGLKDIQRAPLYRYLNWYDRKLNEELF